MIRIGKEKDAKKIAKIKIDNWRVTYLNIFPKELLENLQIDIEIEKYRINLENKNVLVYEEKEEVVAYCYYGKKESKNYEEYEGEIFALYVKNEYQQKGIGTKLLKQALKEISKTCEKILLWCAKKNYRAISFYKKNGFKIIDEKIENVNGCEVEKVAFGIDLKKLKIFNIKKSVNYIEKEKSTAIYANPDLIILKDEPKKWFNQIINNENITNIPQKFINYLVKKEIVELKNITNIL